MTDSQLPHQARIQALQTHLDLVCGLLSKIECAQMLSNDPTDKMRYAEQIAEHKQRKSEFEQELRELGILDPRPTVLPLPENPYLGLAAFRAENQANFFGREKDAQALKKLVEHYHFVALIGASGSGKSSLLFAGLTPLLGDSWLVLEFRPKLRPFYELSKSIIPARYDDGMAQDEAFTELPEKLAQHKIELGILLDAARNKHKKARLLLIADQFEELYTQTESSVRLAFVQCLLNAIEFANTLDAPLTILCSYRADFTGFAIASFGDLLNQQGKLFLDRMNQEELERAITEPALRAGVVLEAGLLSRILEDVGQEAGRLPLLQFALTQLWKQQTKRCLTHQAYEAIGGIEQALATHANQALASFDETEQQRIRQIFMQLVRFGEGTEDTRQVATQAHIADWALVKRLADQRLVMTGQDEDTQQQTVEVVHEALIRHWQPLQAWIQADRAFRLWQEGLRRDMQDNALLRDARLAVAQEWLQQRELELPEAERDFIHASIAQFEAEQAEKLRQRRRWTVFVMMFFVVALGLSGLARWKWLESEYNLSESQKNLALFEENVIRSKRNQSSMLLGLAEGELNKNHPATAIRLALEALPKYSETYPERPFVGAAQNFLTQAINRQYQGVFEHDDNVHDAIFSYDSQKILTISGRQVNVWNINTRQRIYTLQEEVNSINSASFSPDGTKIITTSTSDEIASFLGKHRGEPQNDTIHLWDGNTGKSLMIIQGSSASFSPDGTKILTISEGNTIHVWDSNTGKSLAMLQGHLEFVTSARFSPDGTKIVTASKDKTARVWDSNTGKSITILKGHLELVRWVNFSPDGTKIVTTSEDKTARVWDSNTGKSIAAFHSYLEFISFSNYGKSVINMAYDKTASFSPDSTKIVTIADKIASVWDSNTGKSLTILQGHLGLIRSASFSPDGKKIVTLSEDKTARIWDSHTGKYLAIFQGGLDDIASANFSPDGTKIVTVADKTARVWSSDTNKYSTIFQAHSNDIGLKWLTRNEFIRIIAVTMTSDMKIGSTLSPKETIDETIFSSDGTTLTKLTFPTLEATVAYAKILLPPRDTGEGGEEKLENFRLTCTERKRFFLEELERCKGITH